MKPILLGEAPARSGDGRAFTGRAGERLLSLLELDWYDQLAECFDLRNLFDQPLQKRKTKGDTFDKTEARLNAVTFVRSLSQEGDETVVVAGRRVWRALELHPATPWYEHVRAWDVEFWLIPHPSGVSTYWNSSDNRTTAAMFLRMLLIREGVDLDAIRARGNIMPDDAL